MRNIFIRITCAIAPTLLWTGVASELETSGNRPPVHHNCWSEQNVSFPEMWWVHHWSKTKKKSTLVCNAKASFFEVSQRLLWERHAENVVWPSRHQGNHLAQELAPKDTVSVCWQTMVTKTRILEQVLPQFHLQSCDSWPSLHSGCKRKKCWTELDLMGSLPPGILITNECLQAKSRWHKKVSVVLILSELICMPWPWYEISCVIF